MSGVSIQRLPAPTDAGDPFFSPHVAPAARVTAETPGIGGVIKQRPEDFLVDEQPLYQPCGEGEHLYLLIEKRDLSTTQMLDIVARHFGVERRALGYAGMKDKRAVTRQVVSIHTPGRDLSDFPDLRHDRLGVLWADKHTNKLRLGHLHGNRFSIKIRGVDPLRVRAAMATLSRLASLGVPNRFGAQRFGVAGRNHLVGRALLRGDAPGALAELFCSEPTPGGDPERLETRRAMCEAFAQGRFAEALDASPSRSDPEAKALSALRRRASASRALKAIGAGATRFFVSAFQSAVFNRVVDARLKEEALASLLPGDVAWRHDTGALFMIDEETLADPEIPERLASLSISPSGPLWGPRMKESMGRPGDIERRALDSSGVAPEMIERFDGRLGVRRPLRAPVGSPDAEGGVDEHGPYIRVAFDLPPGSFATVVLDEIMKSDAPGGEGGAASEEQGDGDG